MIKRVELGVTRLGKDLKSYSLTKNGWKKSNSQFPEALKVISLFKANKNFNELIDKNNGKFLKGQISSEGKIQGLRINILPNGKKLDKAYSLFAKNLTIHSESSHDHWDIIYKNPNGKYAYLYTLEKKLNAVKNKYKKVDLFEKVYDKLEKNVENNLFNKQDNYALPLYTLLKTCMRVGNEMHYKETGHKGLTTLKKTDIKIQKDKVQFNYISKSGVPTNTVEQFPQEYIKRLKEKINSSKNNDFIFTDNKNQPLKDTDFMKAFENYCGERFYPHIVRSYYATKKAKDFLEVHSKTASKDEIKSLFMSIANKLGHKKFDKKNNEWKDNYAVTIHHYIQPDLVERIQNLVN